MAIEREHGITSKDEWGRWICSCGEAFLSLRAINGHIQAKAYHSKRKEAETCIQTQAKLK